MLQRILKMLSINLVLFHKEATSLSSSKECRALNIFCSLSWNNCPEKALSKQPCHTVMTLSYAENVGQNVFQGISVIGGENSANELFNVSLGQNRRLQKKSFFVFWFLFFFSYWKFYSLECVKHWANPDTDFWKIWLFWWIKAKGSSCLSWFSSAAEGQV